MRSEARIFACRGATLFDVFSSRGISCKILPKHLDVATSVANQDHPRLVVHVIRSPKPMRATILRLIWLVVVGLGQKLKLIRSFHAVIASRRDMQSEHRLGCSYVVENPINSLQESRIIGKSFRLVFVYR